MHYEHQMWAMNFMICQHYIRGNNPSIHQKGDWIDPRACLNVMLWLLKAEVGLAMTIIQNVWKGFWRIISISIMLCRKRVKGDKQDFIWIVECNNQWIIIFYLNISMWIFSITRKCHSTETNTNKCHMRGHFKQTSANSSNVLHCFAYVAICNIHLIRTIFLQILEDLVSINRINT